MRHAFICAALVMISGVLAPNRACDARTAALEFFERQGLTLLQPAESYIQPGGLIIVSAQSKRKYYRDPSDQVSPALDDLTHFRAVIMQEVRASSTSFDVAVNLADRILQSPVGVTSSTNGQVTLGGIEATGVRLTSAQVDELIGKPKTTAAAAEQLKKGIDVFVIQKVLTAKSLSITASDSQSLGLKLGNGQPVPSCPSALAPSTPQPKPTGMASEVPSASVGYCSTTSYSLTLNASSPIPFAIGMLKLELGNDGHLHIVYDRMLSKPPALLEKLERRTSGTN